MKKVLGILLSLVLLCNSLPAMTVDAANTFIVDCNSVIREATHCANGSLYGVIENTPGDLNTLVAPLHPYVMRNPARGSWGNQHAFGDAIKVAKRLSSIPGAEVSIDLADILPYWPYKWPGLQGWLDQVKSFIDDKKKSGCTNWYGYEIWNEPDGTFKNNGISFEEMWKATYNLIRQNDPGEKIIGPCDSYYNPTRLRSFLTYCKQNNCLPDIMSWHELSGVEWVSGHIRDYRAMEKSLGIAPLPLSINEYCDAEHELEGQPGSSARFIGKFERYQVESAMISWWFVPKPGRLGSLLATDTQKGAGWYFYKWYGDMTGNMVNVTPPNDDSKLVDGAACVDSNQKYISFIFGGPNDGTIRTTIKNIPSFIGSTANVKIEKIDWVSKDTVSYGPTTVSSQNYNVVNGQITVSLSGCNASSGYRIYVTKAGDGSVVTPTQTVPTSDPSSDVVSGGTYKLVNRNSGKLLVVNKDETVNGADVIQWSDNGMPGQHWKIMNTGSGYSIVNVNANKALDVKERSTDNGGDVIIWNDNGQTNQRWYLASTGDGYYTLENINSGKCLDVEKGSMSDGANVLQWAANGGYNQQWKLVRIDQPVVTNPPTQTPAPSTTTPVVEPSKQPETIAPSQPAGNVSALKVSVATDGWDSGYNMNVILENTSNAPITNWKLTFNANQINMSSIWCASKTISAGTLTITPESYNAVIAPAGTVSFGGSCSGSVPAGAKYTFSYEQNGSWYESTGVIV